MRRLSALLLGFSLACQPEPTIDGLLPADDPDLQYIEWLCVPARGSGRAFIQQALSDSERAPVAYVGATDCALCRTYRATLETELMKSVHQGVLILELDRDRHAALLAQMNVRPSDLPHWEALDEFGMATGLRTDGRAWSAAPDAQMAPVMRTFFESVADR